MAHTFTFCLPNELRTVEITIDSQYTYDEALIIAKQICLERQHNGERWHEAHLIGKYSNGIERFI